MDIETATQTVNDGKELMLVRLAEDGIITKEQCERFRREYIICIAKKRWFSWLFREKETDNTGYTYQMARLASAASEESKALNVGKD